MGKWDNLRFDRWTPLCPHSLPYRLYKSYDNDLMGMIISDEQNVSKDDALVNRIYYGSYDEKRPDYKGYFIKERTFEILQ